MSSLRRNVLIGAGLWTVGLLAVWAVYITLYGAHMRGVIVVHSYPHTLAMVAVVSMVIGFCDRARGTAAASTNSGAGSVRCARDRRARSRGRIQARCSRW